MVTFMAVIIHEVANFNFQLGREIIVWELLLALLLFPCAVLIATILGADVFADELVKDMHHIAR